MSQAEVTEISGAETAERMEANISTRTAALREEGIEPSLTILSDNYVEGSPTQKYIDLKIKVGARLGVMAASIVDCDLDNLNRLIQRRNSDPDTHGIIVQLPMTSLKGRSRQSRIEITEYILNCIKPEKDVDGLGENAAHNPATPSGIVDLLEGNDIDYLGRPVVVRGLGKLVGAPLLEILQERGAKHVEGIDINTPEDEAHRLINRADVIITATGQAGGLTPHTFDSANPKAIIDAGTAEQNGKIAGDVSDELREWGAQNGWRFTPKKGASGRLTVLNLLSNVTTAAEKSIDR